ncbi:MAG: hypothetical protein JNL78_14760 [Rhodocyclaceae bacterium]|jgi:hypothetical protein|nr:hypothetical protein [Rhodocyclaceae bacterium]
MRLHPSRPALLSSLALGGALLWGVLEFLALQRSRLAESRLLGRRRAS